MPVRSEIYTQGMVWLGTESNRRHADFQSAALPTELPSRVATSLDSTIKRVAIFESTVEQCYSCGFFGRSGASIAFCSMRWSSSSVTLAQLDWRQGNRRRADVPNPSKQIQPSWKSPRNCRPLELALLRPGITGHARHGRPVSSVNSRTPIAVFPACLPTADSPDLLLAS